MLACYLLTLAPGVTFWDAGEFIAAAWTFGIPHPPGTPLFVALGHCWVLALGPLLGAARAMNLLSAMATAGAGGVTAWLFVREGNDTDTALDRSQHETRAWRAVAAALCAGFMASAWANATETEVYAIALLHGTLMLACAARAGDESTDGAWRWTFATAYAMLLAPAVHLSVLVVAPAAIALAARERGGRWHLHRAAALFGVLLVAAGVGRVSASLVVVGIAVVLLSMTARGGPISAARATAVMALAAIAGSALLIMIVRARHDPAVNQGNPSTFTALGDVVARRQYDVAALWPRRAPAWLQLANVFQYVDWQIALGWGDGVFTSPLRVAATLVFALLGVVGARTLRRDSKRLGDATLVLLVCGTLGVAAYLNLRAGASLGWGVLPDSVPHEARERDYFFVYGFWAWGCLAACGAMVVARSRRWSPRFAVLLAVLPLAGNWRVMDRRREPERGAAERVAQAILASAPPHGVLFLAGDNDSYPLWYAQEVEGLRRDVSLVTLPLLSATWYSTEVARRTGLQWNADEQVSGTNWRHEQQAALIARAARRAGRPVAASPLLTIAERALLGSDWSLVGVDYRAGEAAGASDAPAVVDGPATAPWSRLAPATTGSANDVDGAPRTMLGLLQCPRLAAPAGLAPAQRDSLEVRCNFR